MSDSKQVEANKAAISGNRRALFGLENKIVENKTTAYLLRESIEENRDLIHRNYQAAFHGNRQLQNANTDALFRNRYAFIRNTKTDTPVQSNFKEISLNAARLAFLDHRSKMNARVIEISTRLATINAELIEVNTSIMGYNGELLAYNAEQIKENASLFDGKVLPGLKDASPEKNAELIAHNKAKIEHLLKRAEENAVKNAKLQIAINANRAKIDANTKIILERRAEIEKNRLAIAVNAQKVMDTVFA